MDKKENSEEQRVPSKSANLSLLTVFGLAQITCLLYVVVKALYKDMQLRHGATVCEISFISSVFLLVATSLCLRIFKQNPIKAIPRDLVIPLVARSALSTTAYIVVTKIVDLVPLTVFEAIANVAPFVTAIVAYFWLGDKITCC